MGNWDQGGARPAAEPSIRSEQGPRRCPFGHEYAHIYPDPGGCGFTWETVDYGENESISHFQLNAPPMPNFPISLLSIEFGPTAHLRWNDKQIIKLTSMTLKLYQSYPKKLNGPIAIVPQNLFLEIAREVKGFKGLNLREKPRTTTAPPPPPQVSSSSSAPAEKPILLPKPVVTPPSSAPEGAQRPPISTVPPAPMADTSTDSPSPAHSSRKPKPVREPSREHPFLLPRDLAPPPAARPRVPVRRLRNAGPKLDPEYKARLVAHNALIAQREKGFPTDIVIAFVEELDRARQFARFNNYLREVYGEVKHDNVPSDVSYKLIKDNEKNKEFNPLDEYDIATLVDDYVRELRRKHYYYVKGYEYEAKQPVDGSIRDPVFYLEFRAREEGYVLDENPEVELKKLKKFAPNFYRNRFVCRKPPAEVEARTVTVSNIAFDVPEKNIREFFRDRGIITCVETESTPECQIAHITYKDLEGAESAQTLTGYSFPEVSKLIKPGETIYPMSKNNDESSYAPLLVLPKFSGESPAKTTEDVSSMHVKALQQYSKLRTYYSENHSKHGEAAEKGSYGRCPWMGWMTVESMSNGGYTVGGQKLRHRPKAS